MVAQKSEMLNRLDLKFDFVKARLLDHKISLNGCWQYQGRTNDHGYGKITLHCAEFNPAKRTYSAHRLSWAFYKGEDPGQLNVLHRCDNPCCINPSHLFLGTQADNMRDMAQKRRSTAGESNPRSKITREIVLDVVAGIEQGKGNTEIAEALPISHAMVSLIRGGKSWRSVTLDAGYDPEQHRVFRRS